MHAVHRPTQYWLSMALLALAGLLVVGFFWLGGFFSKQQGGPTREVLRQVEAVNRHMSLVRNILLKGKDSKGRRYEIRAESSRMDEAHPHYNFLRNVSGSMEQADGSTLVFTARQARVNTKTRTVELMDHAVIRKPGKWELNGPRFWFRVKTHDLGSDAPVIARLKNGEIHARGMRATDEGRVIRFTGPVQAHFEEPGEAPQSAESPTRQAPPAPRSSGQ